MKERPILFKPEMIRAILDGRKTMTRRAIKPQSINKFEFLGYNNTTIAYFGDTPEDGIRCPYGIPGDELWVRENWAQCGYDRVKKLAQVKYEADGQYTNNYSWHPKERYTVDMPWRPSIHMFREFSRIQLKITDVRVERLQDITEEDAIAEGIEPLQGGAQVEFKNLWDSINAKPKPVYVKKQIHHYESFPWDDIQETIEYRGKPWHVYGNAWLWCVSFERIK